MLEEQSMSDSQVSATTPPLQDDGDGVWTKDIEDAFEEALAIYPPCGRRKIILTDEGKMYGRNELIARYIKMRTGKSRSRKQVSSHIQVLARKKQREFANKTKMTPNAAVARGGYAGLSSAEIVSQSIVRDRVGSMPGQGMPNAHHVGSAYTSSNQINSGLQLALDHFSCYLEYPQGGKHTFLVLNGGASFVDPSLEHIDIPQIHDKFPGLREAYLKGPKHSFFLIKFWVDLHFDIIPPSNNNGISSRGFMAMDSLFESHEALTVEVSSSVVSLGKQVVEKIEIMQPVQERDRYVYSMARAPLCDYLMSFVHKLRELNTPEIMNRVLENFSATMVVRNHLTHEVLFYTALVFEVTPPGYGPRCNVYKLADSNHDGLGSRRFTT
eukprot:m.323920 g.323920  ORF g.323920 m.323920 type:complete len:383 (+) comp16539_c0_seq25:128-1276(+)